MSLTTDVPVQFDDIRVGDYIIGTGRPESSIRGATNEGFVLELTLNSFGKKGVKVTRAFGSSTTMGESVRTFTRRTHAQNPALHLVDPNAISLGDKVTVYNGARALDEGVIVDDLNPCGDGWDIYLSSVNNRCTDVNPQYQWFRHVTLPENWESLGQISDQTHYPTIHHLKAAIFDLLVQNVGNNTWCEAGASEFARDHTIATGLDASGLEDSARVVSNTIARLQRETAESLSISQAELDQAFKSLGIPQLPKTRRVRLEVEVPEGLTHNQIREMLAGQQDITLLVTQEVSR